MDTRRGSRGLLTGLLLLGYGASVAHAHRTCLRVPLEQRWDEALWVIEARIVHTEAATRTEFGTPLQTTFDVEEVWKGDPPRGEITLGYQRVPGSRSVPGISPGRTMLLFVRGSRSAPLYSLGCGYAEYVEESDRDELERLHPRAGGCASCHAAPITTGLLWPLALLMAIARWRRSSSAGR